MAFPEVRFATYIGLGIDSREGAAAVLRQLVIAFAESL
jgi:hypothetical protein